MESTGAIENIQLQQQGLKFLYEMELVDDPVLINNLKLNILARSSLIKDLEILILNRFGRKEMLIWLDISLYGRLFKKTQLIRETERIVSQLLPSFKLRVTSNKHILNAAVENVKKFFAPEE